MKTGLDLITEERERQKLKEGYDAHHDYLHSNRELAKAAMCYWGYGSAWTDEDIHDMWPWELSSWKPKDRLRNLVRAGALFLAQSDRDGNNSCDTELRMICRKIDQVLKSASGFIKVTMSFKAKEINPSTNDKGILTPVPKGYKFLYVGMAQLGDKNEMVDIYRNSKDEFWFKTTLVSN